MPKFNKLNSRCNSVATYYEGGYGGGGGYHEPTETRMVFRSNEQGMWYAKVGIFSGDVYEWLYEC